MDAASSRKRPRQGGAKVRSSGSNQPCSRSSSRDAGLVHSDPEPEDSQADSILSSDDINQIVKFNVGGQVMHTLKSTLTAEPSLLSEWACNDFASVPRDENGLPLIDRDASNFVNILNYLRGYDVPLPAEQLLLLAEDAEYFRIESLCELIGMRAPPQWQFLSGPGVSPNKTEFTTSNIVGLCGSEPLEPRGIHSITFRMEKCELVSVGVVACEGCREDRTLHQQNNSISYRNTGELATYINGDQLFSQGERYKETDCIKVVVQFINNLVVPSQGGEASVATQQTAADDASIEGSTESQLTGRAADTSSGGAQGIVQTMSVQNRLAHSTAPTLTSGREDAAGEGTQLTQAPESVGAHVCFMHGKTVIHSADWYPPVPPLKFAVGLYGTSMITITNFFPKKNTVPFEDGDNDGFDGVGVDDLRAYYAEDNTNPS